MGADARHRLGGRGGVRPSAGISGGCGCLHCLRSGCAFKPGNDVF